VIELAREVRVAVPIDPAQRPDRVGWNTFASWPSPEGLSLCWGIVVRCRGTSDPVTGYLINIAEIDATVRTAALPMLERAVLTRPAPRPIGVLASIVEELRTSLGGLVHSVEWRLTPYHQLSMSVADRTKAVLTETFEFAAAHRLNCPQLSPEENRRLFGKCNNPGGHGHNYRVAVSVAVPIDGRSRSGAFGMADLERIVSERVISRFDHRNLDSDVPDFAGRNSSVENIVRACHDLLVEPIAAAGAELKRVVVWETEKTSCAYPA
jgi:6-pyruvoyltetrahydropterin/6-carboxytetrahydropterin synthase